MPGGGGLRSSEYWQARARESRARAAEMWDAEAKATMLDVAAMYDGLAAHAALRETSHASPANDANC